MRNNSNMRPVAKGLRVLVGRMILVFVVLTAAAAPAAAQPSCESSDGRTAVRFGGEVSGQHNFAFPLAPGWAFMLTPSQFGYDIRVVDDAGLDLSQITPPFRGANPREVYGWYFRNAANTGPNMGDVNASQELRLFSFSPALTGTGGFRPPDGALAVEPDPNNGRGWLLVTDYGLADLNAGELARMVYLRFEACLTWPSEFDPPVAPIAHVDFGPEIVERIRACGLEPSLEPLTYLQPPTFEIDFDFDGAWDLFVPVARISDGKRAIAICHGGTRLEVIGLEGDIGQLQPAYFDRMDWWVAEPRGPIGQGIGEGLPPFPAGDTITIGIDDSSSVKIYWDGNAVQAYWQGD